jgi:hypothetical protein
MALFEFHIANAMSGKSRNANDRPKADGLYIMSKEELSQYGIIADPMPRPTATFDKIRRDALLIDYRALSSADQTQTMEGRNLATRIARLGGDTKEGIAPAPLKNRTLTSGWIGKEEYIGHINDSLIFHTFESSVLSYFAGFDSLDFFARMFNYHSDEQCGQVHGYISVDPIIRTSVLQKVIDDESFSLDEIISRRLPPVTHPRKKRKNKKSGGKAKKTATRTSKQ